jgi:hypothetical protein|nr:MAG TPA: tail protein [Caudoviricetes sp.]
MDILLKPDILSLLGNINHFIVSSNVEVVFRLVQEPDGKAILEHGYTPDVDNRIDIDLTETLSPLFKFDLRDVSEPYRQDGIVHKFAAELTPAGGLAMRVKFTVLRGGVDRFSEAASSFLRANFLTWQPNTKPVTYHTPEFLTYYATSDCTLRCEAHVEHDGAKETKKLELATLQGGHAWTIPVQYAIIAGKLGENPLYYDIFVEDTQGNRLTYVQRYYPTDIRSEEETWILFENSLGGLDTFRAFGKTTKTAKHTHNVAEIEGISEEYRVDTTREFKKNTGHLDRRERQWLLDFFPSLAKYVYIGTYLRRIVLTESEVTCAERELPTGYSFTYKYADAKPYLNLPRTEPVHELNICVPQSESFTLAPRLVEFPAQPLSEGALFPVQSPYSNEWRTTSAESLTAYITRAIVAGYKNDGAVGHTHANIGTLDALTQMGRYLLLNAKKIAAGQADAADMAKALDEKSADWHKILRKDIPDVANALLTLMEGLKVDKLLESVDFDPINEAGFGLGHGASGRWKLSIPDLVVWGKATFNELEKRKLSFVGGNMVFSSSGSKIVKVQWLDAYGLITADETQCKVYRCFFFQDDGTTATTNLWEKDDQARCQTFNVRNDVYRNVANKNYWRRVVAVGEDYVDLSREDCAADSDVPAIGDTLVQMGHRTKPERQSMIQILVSGDDAPAIVWYAGINGYTLEGKRTAIVSPARVEFNTQLFRLVSGSGAKVAMVADRGYWRQTDTYAYYDRVSHDGSLWLCVAPEGKKVISEPKLGNDEWQRQVSRGEKGEQGEAALELHLDIVRGDMFYREGQGFVAELKATVMKGNADITASLHPSQLVWSRESEDVAGDKDWNAKHREKTDRVEITTDDLTEGNTAIVFTLYNIDGTSHAKEAMEFPH